ncbi:phosphoribosylaminoimidazolesuccinocarboxamide synthase [Rhodocytophaga aerolata]|uniref:Phosphoribosylaminoimidazole-succinocarboxamide synthase n=1 Tax=Rhodocytophaga aerolata TaxID=455078 RepID=A0ABT8R363_9BACT|nr:phosphoribosylaminoimidazolesuccinocarboxamide synthase [Rhodocytophaga aerolata]MDO1446374.1 phosphoribosylaminoimidazolesuccinocarboxamide synthase [Rhodocytophaga aerolata]
MNALKETHFQFKDQTGFYRGKVRDVYFFKDKMAMVASDRISAFDVILPRAIPYKGQVLNQVAARFLQATADIVPNWLLQVPDPNVSIGLKCEPFPVEMVVRGYLSGHAWRQYKAGFRKLCGEQLPDGLKENDPLPRPIITPTTKAKKGHDEDISKQEIISNNLINAKEYAIIERYSLELFARGTAIAKERGLILVDTKYEFGKADNQIYLIDEIHTPDSSRYFYAEGYEDRQQKGEPQKQLSKEFVREWLMANGFQGKDGQKIPHMTDEIVKGISERYIELYEKMTGEPFVRHAEEDILTRIETNINSCLQSLNVTQV